MKREQLRKLELSDDQVDSVMSIHGSDIEKFKDELDSLKTEKDSLNEQISNRDSDIKKLKKDSGSNEELTKRLTDLQGKYKSDTNELRSQLEQNKLDNALNNALVSANVRNPKAARALLNVEDIKLSDQGSLIGLNDQIESLKESDGYLFNEGTRTEYNPAGGEEPQGADSGDNKSISEMAAESRII